MASPEKKTAAGLHQRPKSREETPKEGIGRNKSLPAINMHVHCTKSKGC